MVQFRAACTAIMIHTRRILDGWSVNHGMSSFVKDIRCELWITKCIVFSSNTFGDFFSKTFGDSLCDLKKLLMSILLLFVNCCNSLSLWILFKVSSHYCRVVKFLNKTTTRLWNGWLCKRSHTKDHQHSFEIEWLCKSLTQLQIEAHSLSESILSIKSLAILSQSLCPSYF